MATVREDEGELRRILEAGVHWETLLSLAAREGATRILSQCVSRLLQGGADIQADSDVLTELETRAQGQELKILALDALLDRLLALYREEGVVVLLLKGQAFQRAVLGSPLERPTRDLDILVRIADAERAWELAQAHGWTWDSDTWPRGRYDGHHHLPPLLNNLGLRLEIHTGLFPSPQPTRLPGDRVIQRARPLSGQPGVLVPCPEDLLLHAVVHFAWSHQMAFGAWKTFRDVHALLERGLVDWDDFLAEAQAAQGTRAAFWTFSLGHRLAGIPVPGKVLDALVPPLPPWVQEALGRHFSSCLASLSGVQGIPQSRSVRLDRKLWEVAMQPDGSGAQGIRPWKTGVMQWDRDGQEARAEERSLARASDLVRIGFKDLLHLARILTGR